MVDTDVVLVSGEFVVLKVFKLLPPSLSLQPNKVSPVTIDTTRRIIDTKK